MGKDTFEVGGREFPNVSWWNMKGMRSTYLLLWAAAITSATNGYDGSLINSLQAMPSWIEEMKNPAGPVMGFLVAVMFLGSLVAVPLAPWIADSIGRRWGVVIGCAIMLLGVALVTIGVHIAIFILGRFFLGLGLGIAQSCSPLLLSELVHPQHRAVYSTIYNALWYVGSLIGACVTVGTNKITNDWTWRLPCLLQAIPSVSQLVFIWFVPESPRYLISKGRDDEAKKILAHVHAEGNMDDEMVNVEFQEMRETLRLEKEFEKGSWLEFLKTPGNRHRLIILVSLGFFSQWSGNGLISYYMTRIMNLIGITSPTEVLQMNMYMQVVNVISAVGICFWVDKFGRRRLFLIATAAMMACYVSMTIALSQYSDGTEGGNHNASNAFLVFMFAYYVSYNLAWSGMLVSYACEILPYSLRAKGLTIMFCSVNLSLIFNTQVNPIALDDIGYYYYIVYCVWLAVELAVVWKWFVETKRINLEEIARVFDGAQALIGGVDEKSDSNGETHEVTTKQETA